MTAQKEDLQYEAWGVIVQTSRVRAGHVANGLVQLLRLLPDTPRLAPSGGFEHGRIRGYIADVLAALRARFGATWSLSENARAVCVAGTDAALRFGSDSHATRLLLAGALNADGLVMVSGGSDPTTPGLGFGGYTSTHTLKGMHAATFLGLLSRTLEGCGALRSLYHLLANNEDPHSALIRRLQLALPDTWPTAPVAEVLRDSYPLPEGDRWKLAADQAAIMAGNLLAWSERGMSKANTLMAITDLAALILFLGLLRWREADDAAPPPLLLVVSPLEVEAAHYSVIARAQQNLKSTLAALDQTARERGLVIEKTSPRTNKTTVYWPSVHAQNIGAASGWLYPLDSRGAPRRYLRPGPRQMTTLVHSLVSPGEDLSWSDFTAKVQKLGLVLGGPREATVAAQLRLSGGAFSIREAGRINRHHLVALGLARQESDNVVRVDGGFR